jgi:hypothetical protein
VIAAAWGATLAWAGCSSEIESESAGAAGAGAGGSAEECTLAFLGDPAKEPEVEITVLGLDMSLSTPSDGGTVPLIAPPQGGRIVFAGVRATNVDPCALQLSGSLREIGGDPPEQVRIDSRTINLEPDGQGWGRSRASDLASMANIPVCHNQWSDLAIFGNDYKLTISVRDRDGRAGSRAMTVRPECLLEMEENILFRKDDGTIALTPAQLLAECNCICKKDYKLGEACDGAGGAGGSGGGG